MLATTKLNSMESKISEALINSEISHEDLITTVNEGKNIENQKEALEWWIFKEGRLKKII